MRVSRSRSEQIEADRLVHVRKIIEGVSDRELAVRLSEISRERGDLGHSRVHTPGQLEIAYASLCRQEQVIRAVLAERRSNGGK